MSKLGLVGERTSGQDVRTQNGMLPLHSSFFSKKQVTTLLLNITFFLYNNLIFFLVTACNALANILKSSLGPEGLDKMLVDQIGDITITNDGATILNKLEVEHPAAKVLVELAYLQDQEVGDGTTSVVILAAELLKVKNLHFLPLICTYIF